MRLVSYFILSACAVLSVSCNDRGNILAIRQQGSFFAGGAVKVEPGSYDTYRPQNAAGQTLHGDHAYVSYQIPDDARKYPLVFLHGSGQSAKTWETTPDGREGFSTLFLRRG